MVALQDDIRIWVLVEGRSHRSAARHCGVSRDTVAQMLTKPVEPRERRDRRAKPGQEAVLPPHAALAPGEGSLTALGTQTTLEGAAQVAGVDSTGQRQCRINGAPVGAGAAAGTHTGLPAAGVGAWRAGRVTLGTRRTPAPERGCRWLSWLDGCAAGAPCSWRTFSPSDKRRSCWPAAHLRVLGGCARWSMTISSQPRSRFCRGSAAWSKKPSALFTAGDAVKRFSSRCGLGEGQRRDLVGDAQRTALGLLSEGPCLEALKQRPWEDCWREQQRVMAVGRMETIASWLIVERASWSLACASPGCGSSR